jgi:hypothetical protein
LPRRMRWGDTPSAAATRRAAAFLLVLLFATPVRAGNEYVILGAGSRPCGSWLQARSQASPDSAVLQSWVLGYITSINANVLTITQDIADGTSPDGLYSSIDNYCATHPLDSLARATGNLLDALRAKNGGH